MTDSRTLHRFMMVPRKDMERELKNQEKDLSDDITSLSKKVSLGVRVNTLTAHTELPVVEVSGEAVQRCTVTITRYREFEVTS